MDNEQERDHAEEAANRALMREGDDEPTRTYLVALPLTAYQYHVLCLVMNIEYGRSQLDAVSCPPFREAVEEIRDMLPTAVSVTPPPWTPAGASGAN